MSLDWATIGVISGIVVGVGGLAWKIRSDRRAEEREQRAKRPDVRVAIERAVDWSLLGKDRAVRVRVTNQGDIPIRVVKVSFKEGRPSRRLTMIADSTMWTIEEGEEGLPKEIPPRDGHAFTLPVPVKPQRVIPRPNRPRAGQGSPPRVKPRRMRPSRRAGNPLSETRVQAVAMISTGEDFPSPVYSSTFLPPSLKIVWDPSGSRDR
jgi:hypothetical protein